MEVDEEPPAIGACADLCEDLRRRHGGGASAESRQVMAVLGAVTDAIGERGLAPSPTAVFAAILASLEKEETLSSPEVVAAMCTVLSAALVRMPSSVLRSKQQPAVALMRRVLQRHEDKPATVKTSIGCLPPLLKAADKDDWGEGSRDFSLLLNFVVHPTPKVRKKAVAGVMDVLAALGGHTALQLASNEVEAVCGTVLSQPKCAAKAAAEAAKKDRAAAEEKIKQAVVAALHLLNCLKEVLPLLTGVTVEKICGLLFNLYPLQQQLLSLTTSDVLRSLLDSPQSQLSPGLVAQLLKALGDSVAVHERRSHEVCVALAGVIQTGYQRLHQLDAPTCLQQLPGAVHYLVQLLGAEHDGVRYASVRSLVALLSTCLTDDIVRAAIVSSSSTGAPSPMVSIVAAVASCFGPRYQDTQGMALPVVSTLIEKLGHEGAALARDLVQQLGCVYGGLVEAEQEGNTSEALKHYLGVAESALGASIRNCGPMEVLSVLPLRLIEGLDGDEEARPWMLPLLKKYVQRTSLECWGSELLPLGRALGNRAASLQQAGRGQRAMLCLTLERQIWNTLPSFCIWPKDGDVAYRKHVETIGIAFQKRQELRPPICHALVRLCAQSHTILKDSREGAGFCDLPGVVVEALGSMGDPELDAGSPPSYFTVEVAKRLVVSLREHSAHWLQALYTVFVETQPRDRAPIVQALTAYAAICEPRILGDFFRMVITKLIQRLLALLLWTMWTQALNGVLIQNLKNEDDVSGEGGSEADQMLARSTFMELALCIAAGLDDTGITTLYKVAKQGLQDKDAAVQKKGYKLLAYITNERKHFLLQNFQDVVGTVLGGGSTCLSPAKRFRLQCLNPIIVAAMAKSASGTTQTAIDDGSDEVMDGMADNKGFVQVVDALLTEIILCIKEKNAKARDQAYEVLVNLGRMHKDAGPFTLPQLVTQLLAGLAGTTPHMMSATTCALSRMVYEFSSDLELLVPQILELVLRLLQTKSREVVASVLGFVQVCTRRLPVATLTDHLPLIIDAILLWGNDPKNKFRMKVRTIITRLAVRCGFEEVERLIPEDYSKPFANIRKGQLRKKKKQADDEDDEDDGVDGTYTDGHGGGLAKTALRSEWDHSRIFSEGKDGRSSDVSKNAKSKKSSAWKAFGRLPETGAGGDPLDLLNASTSRQLAKVGAGMAADGAVNPEQDSDDMDLPADPEGRLIINENTLKGKRRGKREREDDSSSSEGDDDRKSAFTMGRTSKRSTAVASGRRSAKSSIHGGDRFRAKKGAGGDVKSKGGVEPYAYWRFDHKLLNRRRGKKALGKNDLKRILRKGGRRGRAKRARNE